MGVSTQYSDYFDFCNGVDVKGRKMVCEKHFFLFLIAEYKKELGKWSQLLF